MLTTSFRARAWRRAALLTLVVIGCKQTVDLPPPVVPAPDTSHAAAAAPEDTTPMPEPPPPPPAPPPPPVVVAVVPKPRPKPKPAPPPPAVDKTPALAPVVVVAPKSAPHKPRPKAAPKPPPVVHPTAAELAADSARRDSIARAEFVEDSIERQAAAFLAAQALADSLYRMEHMRDSIRRAQADSLARERARQDSLAKAAAEDSAYGPDGAMQRIEGDPNIQKPTAGAQLIFVDQVNDTYQQLQLSYARPFMKRSASWEIDVPVQHWDSVSGTKSVTSLANISLIVNKRISSVHSGWRQFVSLTLQPQSGLVDPSVGNNQWTVISQFSISRWFYDDRLQLRFMPNWAYGFAVDSGTTQKNVIMPRVVLTGRVTSKLDAALDWRPRFDITRDQYYATLMAMLSLPLPWDLGLQAGYEFPLDSLAERRVEQSKVYINVTKTFP